MKFFHVYNEECFKGLEKNGLLNKDTGFKIQHSRNVPKERQFNTMAAKLTPSQFRQPDLQYLSFN